MSGRSLSADVTDGPSLYGQDPRGDACDAPGTLISIPNQWTGNSSCTRTQLNASEPSRHELSSTVVHVAESEPAERFG